MPNLEGPPLGLCPRAHQEAFEGHWLHPRATRSAESRGREVLERDCPLRTPFQRDRDRVIHSKAFRRLKHKTQVFIAPEGDHYRTRLTHTLEVSQISRTVARALRLNEDLVEAIAMGHDLGHTPFGHAGEQTFDGLVEGGFRHNEQSVRVVTTLEPMNLTREVLDGILNHTGPDAPATLEGQIVKVADRIAYLNHDIDDALRAGILAPEDLPPFIAATFGATKGERIASRVTDLVETTARDYERVRMSDAMQAPFLDLRAFMFQAVYYGSKAKREEGKARRIVEQLYRHFLEHPDDLARALEQPVGAHEVSRRATDFIAGMTDRYAVQHYERLFVPRPWRLGDEEAR